MQLATKGFLPPSGRPLHASHRLPKAASSTPWRAISPLGREKPDASPADLPDFDVTYVLPGAALAAAVKKSLRAGALFRLVFPDKRMPPSIGCKETAQLKPYEQPVPIPLHATASKTCGIS